MLLFLSASAYADDPIMLLAHHENGRITFRPNHPDQSVSCFLSDGFGRDDDRFWVTPQLLRFDEIDTVFLFVGETFFIIVFEAYGFSSIITL